MILIREGERATWPRVEMIRNCSRIGEKLDQIVKAYEDEALKRLGEALSGAGLSGLPGRKQSVA
jgi:TAG lipase/steryl ester hydrolase/phospholipase A2/LPA acyltransferase